MPVYSGKLSKQYLHFFHAQVSRMHPEFDQQIQQQFNQRSQRDVRDIPRMFFRFRSMYQLDCGPDTGPLYDREMSENFKIFVSVVLNIYGEERRAILSPIATVSYKSRQRISDIAVEVKTRYRCDKVFRANVDKAVLLITQPAGDPASN